MEEMKGLAQMGPDLAKPSQSVHAVLQPCRAEGTSLGAWPHLIAPAVLSRSSGQTYPAVLALTR